jgi:hypothetical protein
VEIADGTAEISQYADWRYRIGLQLLDRYARGSPAWAAWRDRAVPCPEIFSLQPPMQTINNEIRRTEIGRDQLLDRALMMHD